MSLEKRHIHIHIALHFDWVIKTEVITKKKKENKSKHKQTVWSTEDAIKELEITIRNSHLLLFQTLQSFLVSPFFSAGQRFRAITCPLHLTGSYGQLWQISKEPHYQRSKHFFHVHGRESNYKIKLPSLRLEHNKATCLFDLTVLTCKYIKASTNLQSTYLQQDLFTCPAHSFTHLSRLLVFFFKASLHCFSSSFRVQRMLRSTSHSHAWKGRSKHQINN